jgi:hypothetical protein
MLGGWGIILLEGSQSSLSPPDKGSMKVKHYAMKVYGGVDVQIYIFLTSALVGGERLASRSVTLPPGKGPPVPIG